MPATICHRERKRWMPQGNMVLRRMPDLQKHSKDVLVIRRPSASCAPASRRPVKRNRNIFYPERKKEKRK